MTDLLASPPRDWSDYTPTHPTTTTQNRGPMSPHHDLDTIRRLATWGEWDHWTGRSTHEGMNLESGPLCELELGERAAWALLDVGVGRAA